MALLGRIIVIVFAVMVASMAAGMAIAMAPARAAMARFQRRCRRARRLLGHGVLRRDLHRRGRPAAAGDPDRPCRKLQNPLAAGACGGRRRAAAARLLRQRACPNRYEESIDHPPPPISREAEIAAAAGVVFGLVYWVIAGRKAGRWRERSAPMPNLIRSSPRPAYARFASYGALGVCRSAEREGGKRRTQRCDSRLRGNERIIFSPTPARLPAGRCPRTIRRRP